MRQQTGGMLMWGDIVRNLTWKTPSGTPIQHMVRKGILWDEHLFFFDGMLIVRRVTWRGHGRVGRKLRRKIFEVEAGWTRKYGVPQSSMEGG